MLPDSKSALKGTHLQSVGNVNAKMTELLRRVEVISYSLALNNGRHILDPAGIVGWGSIL